MSDSPAQPLLERVPSFDAMRLILPLLLFVLAPDLCAQSPELPIRLDGRIGEEEWARAARHDLTGGCETLLRWDDEDFYVAVRGVADGWSHLYVSHGDTVLVFHASAALGTAAYTPGEAGVWNRIASFDWAVRDTTFTPEAKAARAAFFAEHGWVANTNAMGSGSEIEFRISGRLMRAPGVYVAVLFASDSAHPTYWPATLSDDVLDERLIRGAPPTPLHFEPVGWASVPQPSR